MLLSKNDLKTRSEVVLDHLFSDINKNQTQCEQKEEPALCQLPQQAEKYLSQSKPKGLLSSYLNCVQR